MEDWDGIGRSAGYSNEKEMLEAFYLEDGLSVKDIGKRLGCGIATIANRLAKHGIPKRTRGGPNNTHRLTRILFRLDQRLVFSTPSAELGKRLNMHESTVYKYKRSVEHP